MSSANNNGIQQSNDPQVLVQQKGQELSSKGLIKDGDVNQSESTASEKSEVPSSKFPKLEKVSTASDQNSPVKNTGLMPTSISNNNSNEIQSRINTQTQKTHQIGSEGDVGRVSPGREEHCNENIKSEVQTGSLSPRSASSSSTEGSNIPEGAKKAKQVHSHSINHVAEKTPSNPALHHTTSIKSPSTSKEMVSNTSTKRASPPLPSPAITGPATINNITSTSAPKQNNSKQSKSGKSRARATGGRPRSNSVPFDFHSTNSKSNSTLKSSSPTNSNKSGRLRRGKWTVEEEAYVARVIQDFNSGYLNAPPGTTLRTYLSDKLNCDPMRITKKFTGDSCIGKRVFHPAVRCSNNAALIDKAQVCGIKIIFLSSSFLSQYIINGYISSSSLFTYFRYYLMIQSELDALERRWRKRLEIQQKEAAKKQAASAAAAAAAVSGRMLGKSLHTSLGSNGNRAVVAQTASWLDRANAILTQSHSNEGTEQEREIVKSTSDEVEKEMKEVEQLIHEGPIIQQTSAGLSTLLQQKSLILSTNESAKNATSNSIDASNKRKVSDDTSTTNNNTGVQLGNVKHQVQFYQSSSEDYSESQTHFHDKRMRRSFSYNNVQDHEDAVTLMGFLSSVRQAAASSSASSK